MEPGAGASGTADPAPIHDTPTPDTWPFFWDPQAHTRSAARGEGVGAQGIYQSFTDTSRLPLSIRLQPHSDSVNALAFNEQPFHWILGTFSEGVFSVKSDRTLKKTSSVTCKLCGPGQVTRPL